MVWKRQSHNGEMFGYPHVTVQKHASLHAGIWQVLEALFTLYRLKQETYIFNSSPELNIKV